ncbi:MAG TPA: rhodanese-like domain-containing protein [Thermoanaerobaculia bacterium]
MLKNSFVRAVVLIGIALVLAIVTNGFASRTRRLVLPGFYPDALRVPPKQPEAALPTPVTPPVTATVAEATTTTVAPIVTETIPVPTATIATATTAAPSPAPTPTPAPAPAPPADPLARFKPHPKEPYVEISGADAATLHASGVLFLDARRTSVYEAGHIAGARTFSVWESDIDDKVNALYEERSDPRDQDKPIVIYCSGGACEDSHMLSQKLWGIQFNNLYVYKDGFPDWQNRGGAVKTGGQP